MKTIFAKRYCILFKQYLLYCLIVIFLSGFNFSDAGKLRKDIRREIKAELEKIIEKTPSGKLRTTWRQKKAIAEDALNMALVLDSPRFCPKKWDEAVILFKKAKKYAAKREYRKAIYLAKKTKEFADVAYKCASSHIQEETSRLQKVYQELRSQMDEIQAMIPPDAEKLTEDASQISLSIEDMRLAIDLREFKNADLLASTLKKRLSSLEKQVHKYNLEHESEEDL